MPVWAATLFLLIAIPFDALANHTYRIGSQVLVTGDSADRVRALLGKPVRVTKGTMRAQASRQAKPRRHRGGRDTPVNRQQRVERWHYRHEGRHLIVSMASGRVVDIVAER